MTCYVEEVLHHQPPASNFRESIKLVSTVHAMITKSDRFNLTPEEKIEYDKRMLSHYEFIVPVLMRRLEEKETIIADLREQIGLLLPCVDDKKLCENTETQSVASAALSNTSK